MQWAAGALDVWCCWCPYNTALSFALPAISQACSTAAQLLWIVDAYPRSSRPCDPHWAAGRPHRPPEDALHRLHGLRADLAARGLRPERAVAAGSRVGTAVFGSTPLPTTLSLPRTVFTTTGSAAWPLPSGPPGSARGSRRSPAVPA
ncbi:hypothetical protein QJS66_12665 [Kocuria rhizophila]|nr:hypothetical protein QJS66_12665 [Kocuria rhizophila]